MPGGAPGRTRLPRLTLACGLLLLLDRANRGVTGRTPRSIQRRLGHLERAGERGDRPDGAARLEAELVNAVAARAGDVDGGQGPAREGQTLAGAHDSDAHGVLT